MMAEPGRGDIVNDYRVARARLRLGRYERYLAEWLAARVARLSDKRDAEVRGGSDLGDVHEAGGGEVASNPLAGAPANNPPV